jgi:hypothetical protein
MVGNEVGTTDDGSLNGFDEGLPEGAPEIDAPEIDAPRDPGGNEFG